MFGITWNRKSAFWTLNATGWLTLALLNELIYYRHANVWVLLTMIAAGFLVSIPLRYIYRFAIARGRRGPGIIVLILGLSFVAANVWSLAAQSSYELLGCNEPHVLD